MRRFAAVLAALTMLVVAGCDRDDLIDSPADGAIVPGSTVTVTGAIPDDLDLGGTLRVNGVTAAVGADRTWSVAVPQATTGYVTPIEVVYTAPGGTEWRASSGPSCGATRSTRAPSRPRAWACTSPTPASTGWGR